MATIPFRFVRAGFASFEGIDGAGKTTVSRLVAERLAKRGESVFLTAEPTEGWIGQAVRRSYEEDVGPIAETFLFLADRAVHQEEIRRRLAAGEIVLCDRYADSTYAYQGARLRGVLRDPVGFLRRATEPWFLSPDVTILLRVPPEVGMRRLDDRVRKVRFEDAAFLKQVAANYDRLARSKRFVVLDARKPADEVAHEAAAAIEKRLKRTARRR